MKVRNRVTGLLHMVPPGHWSLSNPDYEAFPDKPEPEPEPVKGSAPPAPKRKRAPKRE